MRKTHSSSYIYPISRTLYTWFDPIFEIQRKKRADVCLKSTSTIQKSSVNIQLMHSFEVNIIQLLTNEALDMM